ncbi:MAG: hypothetical protein JNJ57_17385 [Saprospiraceae bacterium]|nr:hypothetical protein [Saprospiraceae bacterium]
MTTIEMVKVYIAQLCTQIGTTPEAVYSQEFNSWNFSKGDINIEVFFTSYETSQKTIRTFMRCFAVVYPMPVEAQKQLDLYRVTMECNSNYMGVKIGVINGKPFIYAIAERDIDGMDYTEFSTLIFDHAYWAERLSNELKTKLGAPQTNLN